MSDENSMLDLPAAIIIGIICGLMGAFFISVSISMGMQRKKFINTKVRKIIEACFFAFVTASCFYGVVAIRRNNCKPEEGSTIDAEEEF